MGLFDKLKEALAPAAELAHYRELFGSLSGGKKLNQWYRCMSQANDLVGFEHICVCGTSYTMLSVTDWMKIHRCHCGNELDLFKACEIPAGTPFSDLLP